MQNETAAAHLETLFNERFHALLSTVTALLGDVEVARDVVQDAFARALRHAGQYEGTGTVEAWRYENGSRERVMPVQGWVLAEIGPEHYRPGHRLTEIVGLDADGKVVDKQAHDPEAVGVDPCEKRSDLGGGVRGCE